MCFVATGLEPSEKRGQDMNIVRMLIVSSLLMLMTNHAAAHHSWAAIFNTEGDAEIDGVVSKIVWRNPHIQLEVTTDLGTPEEKVWDIESNSVASLVRMGVNSDVLTEGTQVTIAGYPIREGGEGSIFMNHLLLPDNTEVIFLRGAEPRWQGEHIGTSDRLHGKVVEEDFSKRPTSIFAVWNTIYGAEGSHQALGGPVDWTDYALEKQERDRAAGLGGPPDRHDCSPRGFLQAFGAPYPIQLIDEGDQIIIKAEFFDTVREIHMNDTNENPVIPKDGLGYSTGHWVGDTLVVDTLLYRESGVDGDDHHQVHETFHLSVDHNRLAYTRTIVDPLMRKMPTMAKRWWEYQPGAFVQPYDCSP